MAEAKRDENRVTTMTAALNTNGTTVINIMADPSIHAIEINDGATGSSSGGTDAIRDQNFVPVLLAVSSVDGVTPVPLFATAGGELLIKST